MEFEAATTLDTSTGATLRLYVQAAEGIPRAVVQVNHGLAEHAGRYGRFARFLASHGFNVYAHDHRGHGHTVAPGAPTGSFGPEPCAENVLSDVLAVHDHIAKVHRDRPVIVFGHSMGAMIALAFLARHPDRVSAGAIWNAPFVSTLEARAAKTALAWERFRLGSDVPSRLLPLLTFRSWAKAVPHARTPFDWLSRDQDEVEKYIADPLCGWDATVGMWRAIFDFNLMIAGARAFDAVPRNLPVQFVGGGADPSTHGGKTMTRLETRLQREGFSNLKTSIYPDGRHESLSELDRDSIMEDFVHWAAGTIG